MTDLPDWKTIDRYLAGEASAAERAAVDAWTNAQPNRVAAFAWLRTQSRAAEPQFDADTAWRNFKRRPVPLRTMPTVWRIAAAILVVAGLGVTWSALRNRATN